MQIEAIDPFEPYLPAWRADRRARFARFFELLGALQRSEHPYAYAMAEAAADRSRRN